MKYSSNLPIRNYETSIGTFTMVDLCTYFTVNEVNMEKSNFNLDRSTTLVEAAYQVYQDVDSFWLFLFANKKINPFNLANDSNTLNTKKNQLLTGVAAKNEFSVFDSIFLTGSLVVPKTNNTGSAWSYGSTGNFSLTGGFAVVDEFNPFSKRFISKEPVGFTYEVSNPITGLVKGFTGKYSGYDAGVTALVGDVTGKLSLPDEILYTTSDTKEFIKVKSEYPLYQKGSDPGYKPSADTETQVTFEETIDNSFNNIEIYLPATVQYSNFTKVTQQYIV
jgi:hypothetical protein